MSSYFSLPSFARAKKNKEDLEKKNPTEPVLKDEDEKFLQRVATEREGDQQAKDEPPIKIADNGEEKEASKEEHAGTDDVVLPETQPETSTEQKSEPAEEPTESNEQPKQEDTAADTEQPSESVDDATERSDAPKQAGATVETEQPTESTDKPVESSDEPKVDENVEDPPEQVPEDSAEKVETTAAKAKKSKKDKGLAALPSQEEAEAATKGFDAVAQEADKSQQPSEKRTWQSYLPSIGKKGDATGKKDFEENKATEDLSKEAESAESQPGEKSAAEGQPEQKSEKRPDSRSWTEYASAYVPTNLPSMPSIPDSWKRSKDQDSKAEPIYKEDGTIDEEATKAKQEKEVSVLLDNLNLSSINNRVFSFSEESQKIYHRFTLILKDVIEGGPTAYDDMEKLMHDAGPQLEKQFQNMPPFAQTLVKSLPAKLGTSLGPEILAMASEKPGGDMQARMKAASKQASAGGEPSIQTADAKKEETEKDGKKQKRKIPGLKGLVSQQGAVASMLRSTVNFITTRFPLLASTTNVVFSLAAFILMFVFWYCYKRGHETRLAREAAAAKAAEEGKDPEAVEGDDGPYDATDDEAEDEVDDNVAAKLADTEPIAQQEDNAEAVSEKAEQNMPSDNLEGEGTSGKDEVLGQSEPAEVPLPDKEKGEKGAELEAEKSVGV